MDVPERTVISALKRSHNEREHTSRTSFRPLRFSSPLRSHLSSNKSDDPAKALNKPVTPALNSQTISSSSPGRGIRLLTSHSNRYVSSVKSAASACASRTRGCPSSAERTHKAERRSVICTRNFRCGVRRETARWVMIGGRSRTAEKPRYHIS